MSRKITKEEYNQKLKDKGISNIILVGDYMGCDTKSTFKCLNCRHEWQARPTKVLNEGMHCPNCYIPNDHRKTHKQFMKEFEERGNKNIEILGKYITKRTRIKVRCKKCGYEYDALPNTLLQGCGCQNCRTHTIENKMKVEEDRSIAICRPDLIEYFANKDDAKYIYPYSHDYILVKCPDCGATKKIMMSSLSCNGFHCSECSDHISYPNRLIRGILNNFKSCLDYIEYEWSDEWSNRMRYDVYFEKDGIKYVVEMQGSQHYDSGWGIYKTVEEIKRIDEEKINLAINYQIIPIVIDAKKSEFEYIYSNIKDSILNNLFDLSSLDLKKIEKDITSNLVKQVCEFYDNNPDKFLKDIAEEFGVSKKTATKYIKIGDRLGWCTCRTQVKNINVYDENHNIINTYSSISECARQLTKIYGYGFNTSNIIRSCQKGYAHHGLYFQYA